MKFHMDKMSIAISTSFLLGEIVKDNLIGPCFLPERFNGKYLYSRKIANTIGLSYVVIKTPNIFNKRRRSSTFQFHCPPIFEWILPKSLDRWWRHPTLTFLVSEYESLRPFLGTTSNFPFMPLLQKLLRIKKIILWNNSALPRESMRHRIDTCTADEDVNFQELLWLYFLVSINSLK